jgi:hypothetical protein
MALQLRRGLAANLTTITPAIGELLYVTDYASTNVSPLYIGDGTTPGGSPAGVTSVNGLNGAVSLTTVNVPEGVGAGNRQYFTTDRAQDAAGALLQGGVLSNITISYNSTSNIITISNPSVIQSGSTNSLAYWASGGTTLSPSSSMTWDENSNLLQNINGTVQVVANNNSRSLIIADTYSDSALANSISIRKSRGTNITPLKVISGDSIGSISFQGYDGTNHTISSTIASVAQATPTTGSGKVQSLLSFSITNAQNLFVTAARLTVAGTWHVGPLLTTDAGTGATSVVQTVVGGSAGVYASSLRNYYSDTNGALLDFRKYRGTLAVPTTVVVGDSLGIISGKGYDGSSLPIGATISMVADNTISTGKVPGSIIFSTANSNGVLTQATKIDSTQTLTHNGTITTTKTPGTFWNYDSSSSTITLIVGGTLAFPNFSGSILVNCYNSGTVTQYLCGGGGAPIAVGSSRVTPTGTMTSTSGIAGYTFTATEAGIHSFYVIRTRSGA